MPNEKVPDVCSAARVERGLSNMRIATTFDHSDISNVAEFYQQWSQIYDQDMGPSVYKGPRYAVEALCDTIPAGKRRSEVRIIDVAAGTGLVGVELAKEGFILMDATDMTAAMLEKLKEKGLYERVIQATLGMTEEGQKNADLPENEYDVVICSGGFVQGHMPKTAIWDLIQLAKPGGLIIIAMRYNYLTLVKDYNDMEELMDELESRKNMWRRLRRQIRPNHFAEYEGIVFVYEKI